MKAKVAKEKGFTHLGKMYGTLCYIMYYDDGAFDVRGTTWLRHKFIEFMIWIQCNVYDPHGVFIMEELDEL
jgi:hypothetical protein